MSHLWLEKESGEWAVLPLHEAVAVLGPQPAPVTSSGGNTPVSALLLRSRTATSEEWLLMNVALRPLSVNGEPLRIGIRVINDKDELRGSGIGRMYFSTERLASIEPFCGSDREVRCPRCGLGIEADSPIIRCAACNVAFHQNAATGFLCFTYGPTCPLCGRPTVLSDSYSWDPGEL